MRKGKTRSYRKFLHFVVAVMTLLLAGQSQAVIIDFTGGTVTQYGGSTAVTNGSNSYPSVDYYVEDGFRLDFVSSDPGGMASESIVGNYYFENNDVYSPAHNDVVHGHWAETLYDTNLREIRVTQTNGQPFDLNYFILTSNTAVGGGPASGGEQTYIYGSSDGISITTSLLLPPDDWGFAGTNPQIFLDASFDSIYWFSFSAANYVDCFGMDNFYINEPAPPPVPEPSTIVLLGSGLVGLATLIRRRKQGA